MKPNDKVTVFGLYPGTVKKRYSDTEVVVLFTKDASNILARVAIADVKLREAK